MAEKSETGAAKIDVEEKCIDCYHYKKIDARNVYGLALLATHVYSIDDKSCFSITDHIPGYELLNGEETAKLLIENVIGEPMSKYSNGNSGSYSIDLKEYSGKLKCDLNDNKTVFISESLKITFRKEGGFEDASSGYKAAIYKRNDYKYVNDESGGGEKFVLAIGGSDINDLIWNDLLKDWIYADVNQGIGWRFSYPKQYKETIILGMVVKQALGGSMIVTGHSLGGGLSAATAVTIGVKACTFNPAGLHVPAMSYYINEITSKNNALYRAVNKTFLHLDFLSTNKLETKINGRKALVKAFCSKWDMLSNTQDKEVNSPTSNKGGQSPEKLPEVKNAYHKTGYKALIMAIPLSVLFPPLLPVSMLLLYKWPSIPGTFCDRKIRVDIDTLNYLSNNSRASGHSMDLLLDGLHLKYDRINNNQDMTYQSDKTKSYVDEQWAEESNSKCTILYMMQDEAGDKLAVPDTKCMRRKEKNDPKFRSDWVKVKSRRFEVEVEYGENKECLADAGTNKKKKKRDVYIPYDGVAAGIIG